MENITKRKFFEENKWMLWIIMILVVVIIILGVGNFNKMSSITSQDATIRDLKAPNEKLEAFSQERTDAIDAITKADEEIKSWEESKRLNTSIKDNVEKQIRCQRAVVSGIEEWDCNDENTYEDYTIHP